MRGRLRQGPPGPEGGREDGRRELLSVGGFNVSDSSVTVGGNELRAA